MNNDGHVGIVPRKATPAVVRVKPSKTRLPPNAMRELAKPMLLLALVLLVLIAPFVLLGGDAFERRLEAWLSGQAHRQEIALGVVALLAADMVLPVPSSGVSTLAGARLGVGPATAASWLGMTIGSVLGFALARWWGEPLARRLSGKQDMVRLQQVTSRYGAMALAMTRPVPILAEATVFLLGATRLAWKPFLVVALLSNLAIAFVYSLLGWLSFERGQLAIAVAASIGLPVIATLIARRLLPATHLETFSPSPRCGTQRVPGGSGGEGSETIQH